MRSHASTTDDGVGYRDLNHNGRLDPYEDPRLTPEERTADLLSQLSLAEKVGLMFHTIIESGPGGTIPMVHVPFGVANRRIVERTDTIP